MHPIEGLLPFFFLVSHTLASASTSTLTPPVLPLLVRNPYLSTWLEDARHPPWHSWPIFWTGEHLGLSIMVLIPESTRVYPLLGRPQDSLPPSLRQRIAEPSSFSTSFDASTTNITYRLDDIPNAKTCNSTIVTVSFLSPITPESTFRQSLPAAYFTIHIEGQREVHVYSDVNGQWVSGNRDSQIIWDLAPPHQADKGSHIKSWKVARASEALLTEINDRSEWGTLFFTGPDSATHQAGTSELLRCQFAENGRLTNDIDRRYRGIMDEEPVFAFATSLHPSVNHGGSDSVTLTVGLGQDPVVQFAAARGLTMMRPLWASYIPNAQDMIAYHYYDFPAAVNSSLRYSEKLSADATSLVSTTYRDIVALSARQVMGASVFSGTPEDPLLFLKEISSNGNFQTVDVIFPAFPFFLYTNPRWLVHLLEPLIEHQLSGQYPNNYSMHDLGTHFPNATGHSDGADEYMPVEECGDMLIMGLAAVHALKTERETTRGNLDTSTSAEEVIRHPWAIRIDDQGFDMPFSSSSKSSARNWIARSYKLWEQWTEYLVREALIPRNQLSTDDFAGRLANQTNLALKGIVGIRAMSELSSLVEQDDAAKRYRKISEGFIDEWQDYAISRDGTHAKLSYTWYGSWTTIYNLFADALLCFDTWDSTATVATGRGDQQPLESATKPSRLVPIDIYKMQSKWYKAVMQKYGLPLDSRHLYTKSDWEFFAAAVTSNSTRHEVIEAVGRWINETVTDRPLTDLYDTEGQGDFSPVRFMARPVVGGHFAPLALSTACGGKPNQASGLAQDGEQDEAIDVEASLAADLLDSVGDNLPVQDEL